jgi:hypothetical protein
MGADKITQLKGLLGEFIQHVESADPSEESHPLIRATHLTYAFVNAVAEHQRV